MGSIFPFLHRLSNLHPRYFFDDPHPGAGVPASSVSLHLPVQVAAKGNQTSRTPLTEAEAAAELADAEVFLRPRMIEVPSQEHIGNSVLATAPASRELPPSYEDFFSQPRPVVEPGRS